MSKGASQGFGDRLPHGRGSVKTCKHALATLSRAREHAALEVNLPNYASAIVTTDEIVGAIALPAGVEAAAQS
jgi:hypothetical protein